MTAAKANRWEALNAAKRERTHMKKKAKAEAARQSTIKFHVLRLIHYAKPAFRSQTNVGTFLFVSVDLRIWASIEQGRGSHILALLLFGWEWVRAEGHI